MCFVSMDVCIRRCMVLAKLQAAVVECIVRIIRNRSGVVINFIIQDCTVHYGKVIRISRLALNILNHRPMIVTSIVYDIWIPLRNCLVTCSDETVVVFKGVDSRSVHHTSYIRRL